MLDINFIRERPDKVKDSMRKKGEEEIDIDELLQRDSHWRRLLQKLESLRAERNEKSKEIGQRKREGMEADDLIEEVRLVNEEIDSLEGNVRELEGYIEEAMINIPNVLHSDVPFGEDEEANVEVRRVGEKPSFSFEPKAHWDIGAELGILDTEQAAKIAGSRFNVLKDDAARMVRALINLMLDIQVGKNGYREIYPPFLANRDSMIGTGQLPKFASDVFLIEKFDYFLIPTAEVPLTNLYRDEILRADDLPMKFAAYTPCFRAEAGAAGRDTRGLIRRHQFDKVELVQYCLPEESYDVLEEMVSHAESILQALDLPYRVVLMCSGDTGFPQTKKYDLDVWMPSYNEYVEISSVSNFSDFQARRSNIRFRREKDGRPEFVHTLNGSGLAISRTIAAIFENCQTEDGTVELPASLQPYFEGRRLIDG